MTTTISEVTAAVDEVVASSATNAESAQSTRQGFGSFTWLFTAGFAIGGFKVGSARLHDNSFFVHLTTGKWMLEHGAVPRVDYYSFAAAGESFVAQSWLASLVYGALDQSPVGGQGIRVLMGAIAAIIAVSTFRLALRITLDRKRAILVALAAFGVIAAMFSARPLGFGLLGLCAVIWIVEAPTSAIGKRPELAIPIVMWLWGNVHGSMALGYLYLALYLLARAFDGSVAWRPGRERQLAIGTLLSVLAMLANPYGPKLLFFPLELIGRGEALKDVVEWMSPNFHTAAGIAFGVFFAFAFIVIARGNRPSRTDVIVTLPFILLSFWAVRNTAIAALVMVPMVSRSFSVDQRRNETQDLRVGRIAGVAILALCTVFFALTFTQQPYDTQTYSRKAFGFLETNGLLGQKMLTTDANAGWVLAKYFPRQQVFMDDRFDMFPEAVITDYATISRARPGWDARLDHYEIQVVVWPTSNALTQVLALDKRWDRAYRDVEWTVFTRSAT